MRAALLALPLALAGCGGESTTDSAARTGEVRLANAHAGEVAEQVAAAWRFGSPKFQPGQWQVTSQVVNADMTGIPADLRQSMKEAAGLRPSATICITPEQAEQPPLEMFVGDSIRCRFDRYSLGEGKLDAEMTCGEPNGGAGVSKGLMTGRYNPTSYDFRSDLTTESGPHAGSILEMRTSGKRIGECAV